MEDAAAVGLRPVVADDRVRQGQGVPVDDAAAPVAGRVVAHDRAGEGQGAAILDAAATATRVVEASRSVPAHDRVDHGQGAVVLDAAAVGVLRPVAAHDRVGEGQGAPVHDAAAPICSSVPAHDRVGEGQRAAVHDAAAAGVGAVSMRDREAPQQQGRGAPDPEHPLAVPPGEDGPRAGPRHRDVAPDDHPAIASASHGQPVTVPGGGDHSRQRPAGHVARHVPHPAGQWPTSCVYLRSHQYKQSDGSQEDDRGPANGHGLPGHGCTSFRRA